MKKTKKIKLVCARCGEVINPTKDVYYVNGFNLLPLPVCSLGCYAIYMKSLIESGFLNNLETTMGMTGEMSPMSPNFNGNIMLD